MILTHLTLQNFRSYSKASFDFSDETTLIVGPNTSGKTNLMEAIVLLATGESFRAERDQEMVQFGEEIGRVVGADGETKLEVVLLKEGPKKFLLNGIAKRRVDFAGQLHVVLFSPLDLDLITDSPNLRRRFLDAVLSQVDREYRLAIAEYAKVLRQRNVLLERTRETGVRDRQQFAFWDAMLIRHAELVTKKREEFLAFVNASEKAAFPFVVSYDRSTISKARLAQYEAQETAAGATIVGPHRDDFALSFFDNERGEMHDVRLFGSRGQQRLAVLQLRLLERSFIEEQTGDRPMLFLDDIFSELDSKHIHHVLSIVGQQQTVITTTHKEFIPGKLLKTMSVIELA